MFGKKKSTASISPPEGVPGHGGLRQNLAWGYWAAAAAILQLPKGAPNWVTTRGMEEYLRERSHPSTRIDEARKMIHSGVGDAIQQNAAEQWKSENSENRHRLMQIEEELAINEGLGKCSSHCAIAFQFLFNEGVRPLDAMVAPSYFKCHTFVVIGRVSGSTITDPSTWGQASVICDAWLEIACPVSDIGTLPYQGEKAFFTDLREE